MANSRGIVSFELGGQERTIRFTNELMERLEADLELPLNLIIGRMSVRVTVAAIHLGLVKRQAAYSGNPITRKTVTKWLDESDHDISYYMTKVIEGILSYMGESIEDDEVAADSGEEETPQE